MIKVNSKKGRNGKRGFTMVELVISLTIIGIVTLASIGIISAQTRVNVLTNQTIEATNMAENAIECFRYAVNVGGDEETFKQVFEPTLDGDTLTPTANGYQFVKNGLTVNIALDFVSEEKTIHITVEDSSGDNIIDETYTK